LRPLKNISVLAIAAVPFTSCLFVEPDSLAGGGVRDYGFGAEDPAQSDQIGEQSCEQVDADGSCRNGIVGFEGCTCPKRDFCVEEQNQLMHCYDGITTTCTLAWMHCGLAFDESHKYAKQTCIEDGEFGTGCYPEGSLDADGYRVFCTQEPPWVGLACASQNPVNSCTKLPQYIGWATAYPNLGQPEYSCFEDCFHWFEVGGDVISCPGTCCDGCSIAIGDEQVCIPDGTTSTGSGGCPGLDGAYPKTGNACCDGCIDALFGCLQSNNCSDPSGTCSSPYQSCIIDQCNSCT
jgi:hypothetical protein